MKEGNIGKRSGTEGGEWKGREQTHTDRHSTGGNRESKGQEAEAGRGGRRRAEHGAWRCGRQEQRMTIDGAGGGRW